MNDGWIFVALACIGIMMLPGYLWYLGIGMIIAGIYFAEKEFFGKKEVKE